MTAIRVYETLPLGVSEVKRYRDGDMIVKCSHAVIRKRGGGYPGDYCTVCGLTRTDPVADWPTTKMLCRLARQKPQGKRKQVEALF